MQTTSVSARVPIEVADWAESKAKETRITFSRFVANTLMAAMIAERKKK